MIHPNMSSEETDSTKIFEQLHQSRIQIQKKIDNLGRALDILFKYNEDFDKLNNACCSIMDVIGWEEEKLRKNKEHGRKLHGWE